MKFYKKRQKGVLSVKNGNMETKLCSQFAYLSLISSAT